MNSKLDEYRARSEIAPIELGRKLFDSLPAVTAAASSRLRARATTTCPTTTRPMMLVALAMAAGSEIDT